MKSLFRFALSVSVIGLLACQGQVNAPSVAPQEKAPVVLDAEKQLPIRSLAGFKSFGITPATEACGDYRDNNNDKMIDEGCYGCPSTNIVADFNSDGLVDKHDAAVVLLVQYEKTLLKGSDVSCLDLDQSGDIGNQDVIKTLDIADGLVTE